MKKEFVWKEISSNVRSDIKIENSLTNKAPVLALHPLLSYLESTDFMASLNLDFLTPVPDGQMRNRWQSPYLLNQMLKANLSEQIYDFSKK